MRFSLASLPLLPLSLFNAYTDSLPLDLLDFRHYRIHDASAPPEEGWEPRFNLDVADKSSYRHHMTLIIAPRPGSSGRPCRLRRRGWEIETTNIILE